MMGLREYLEQIVRPNVDDLRANYTDVRCAFNAVAAVDALAAHIYQWCCSHTPHQVTELKDDSAYRESLARTNQSFALVRDIAKAQKHVRLIYGSPEVSTADQMETRSLGWGEARWGEGRWGGPPQVVVRTDKGDLRVVESVVEQALSVLEAEMPRLGAIP